MAEPTCSTHSRNEANAIDDLDADIKFDIKEDDEAEIARLELQDEASTADKQTVEPAAAEDDDERIPKIEFSCTKCGMKELVHYYGQTPPFVCGVKFVEDTYVMRDPFQPPPPRWQRKAEYFVALGAKCVRCEHPVCRDAECSFYYTATYCLPCAQQQLKHFAPEAQTRLRKQLAAI